MSRAAQHTTRALTDQQLAQQNQLISQSNRQGQQDRSLIMPTIQSLLTSTGYTPQQQSAITQQSRGAANTAFDALRQRAANRAAATNNSAGFGDLTAQLGREQARTDASLARQNQIDFANQALKEHLAGLNRGQTYGIDTNLLGRAMGVPPELLGVRQRASGSSSSGLGGLLGIGSGIASLFGRGTDPPGYEPLRSARIKLRTVPLLPEGAVTLSVPPFRRRWAPLTSPARRLGVWLRPHDHHGRVHVPRHGFRHAAQREPLPAAPAMRA